MPVKVVKGSGVRPHKIVEKSTGKVVGSSKSKANAQKSANVRNAVHFSNWKPTRVKARKKK